MLYYTYSPEPNSLTSTKNYIITDLQYCSQSTFRPTALEADLQSVAPT